MCEALGLDASGREKQILLDRILGRPNGAEARTSGIVGLRNATNGSSPDPDAKLTREQLEGYLWAAADILRQGEHPLRLAQARREGLRRLGRQVVW